MNIADAAGTMNVSIDTILLIIADILLLLILVMQRWPWHRGP